MYSLWVYCVEMTKKGYKETIAESNPIYQMRYLHVFLFHLNFNKKAKMKTHIHPHKHKKSHLKWFPVVFNSCSRHNSIEYVCCIIILATDVLNFVDFQKRTKKKLNKSNAKIKDNLNGNTSDSAKNCTQQQQQKAFFSVANWIRQGDDGFIAQPLSWVLSN